MNSHFIPIDSPYTTGYCRAFGAETIRIQRNCGAQFHYLFNHITGKLESLECLECQPTVTEQDLFPLYAKYCEELQNFVIFTYNRVSTNVEQYVYCKHSGSFEEVHRPDIIHDITIGLEDVVCAIKYSDELVLIQRDEFKNFKKMKYEEETHGFSRLPAKPVRTLLMKKAENGEIEFDENNEMDFQQDEFLERLENFYIQFCPVLQVNVICVLRRDGTYSRYIPNSLTGGFDPVDCEECQGHITERNLLPLYSVSGYRNQVIFMKNCINFRVEQYIFSEESMCFEQIYDPYIRFDYKKISPADVILPLENGSSLILIGGGCIKKVLKTGDGALKEVGARPVRTMMRLSAAYDQSDVVLDESDDSTASDSSSETTLDDLEDVDVGSIKLLLDSTLDSALGQTADDLEDVPADETSIKSESDDSFEVVNTSASESDVSNIGEYDKLSDESLSEEMDAVKLNDS